MRVEADPKKNQVTLHTDAGSRIVLSWASAVNLGILLTQKGHEAEPPALPGKSYAPATERERV